MSNNSDSQNMSEEQVQMSEGTSPSKSSQDDGSRSTPSNLPKAATRQRRKKTSDSEDEDFVIDEEVSSKRKGYQTESKRNETFARIFLGTKAIQKTWS